MTKVSSSIPSKKTAPIAGAVGATGELEERKKLPNQTKARKAILRMIGIVAFGVTLTLFGGSSGDSSSSSKGITPLYYIDLTPHQVLVLRCSYAIDCPPGFEAISDGETETCVHGE